MSSQEAFLARVRRALHKESLLPATRPPLLWSDQDTTAAALQTRLVAQRPALVAQLQQELDAVGGVVAHVHSAAEAVTYVTRLAQEKDASLVVRWQSDLLDTLEIDAALQQQGVAVHATTLPAEALPGGTSAATVMATRRHALRDVLARDDLGRAGVDYVIAETGTMALTAQAGPHGRVS